MTKDYYVGLDIGTSSIGWSIMDENFHLMKKKHKRTMGVALFEEGKTAAERRIFRTTRRRLARRKWRLKFLEEIFDPYMVQVDPTFFARLKDSNISPLDSKKKFHGSLLFPEKKDTNFYDEFPTIYHLRKALMTENRKFDLREIYLAMHHIVKYRGHFLNSASVSSFETESIDLQSILNAINDILAEKEFAINTENPDEIEQILLDTSMRKLDKQKQLKAILAAKSSKKEINKGNKQIADYFAKAILGYKTKLDVILQKEVESTNEWNFSFSIEGIDDKLAELEPLMEKNEFELTTLIKQIHDWVTLNEIVPNGQSLSESMVKKYEDHKEQLKLYKALIKKVAEKDNKTLKQAYDDYIDNALSNEEFTKKAKKVFDKYADLEEIKQLQAAIELDNFMPKQRTSANGVIPHQLHQKELDRIIENQAKYYPWLAEENPNEKRRSVAKYKLDELVAFRVPYYVGPMIEKNDQNENGNGKFAWMVRKDTGAITPWNFDEKVDRNQSAENFIKRMTTKDTYLLGEDVLPDNSLIYQRFKVLNELNVIRINGHKLTVGLKQRIFNDLFTKNQTVTANKLIHYLESTGDHLTTPRISGLSSETKFNSSLSTYIKFKNIFGEKVDNPDYLDDLEKIIEWATVFEDNGIFMEKLKEISWLSTSEITQLKGLRLKGWGRLSRKLLTEIVDENGQRIIDRLWNTNDNLMQIVSSDKIAKQIADYNKQFVTNSDIESILADAYTSPQNKKAIRKVVKVIDDIQNVMGHAPKAISIEFTRSEQKSERTKSRMRQIQDTYKKFASEITDETLKNELNSKKNNRDFSDRLYLYFTQLGRDAYTGKKLNIDNLSNYDIDHIMPQSFIKDDSLDNKVLVSRAVNNDKSDNVPLELYGNNVMPESVLGAKTIRQFWGKLKDKKLISNKKLKNLCTKPDEISKYAKEGFVKRQLVETSQVVKLVSTILTEKYQDSGTKIIEVRAAMTHEFREMFNYIKLRNLNDFHHGFDAYIVNVIGLYLYKRYPKLRNYFVYNDFKKMDKSGLKNLKRFNFLNDLKTKDVIKYDGEFVLDKNDLIKNMNRAYESKVVPVAKEVYTNENNMFKQTIFPASKASSKKLIMIKKNKPVNIYGGYTSNNDAYLAIVKQKDKYQVVGIPMRSLERLQQAEKDGRYNEVLKQELEPQFIQKKKDRKTGAITETIKDFEIVLGKVPFGQLIVDVDQKFTLGSSTYKYNASQLTLSKESIKIIDLIGKNKNSSEDLDQVYLEILDKVNRYFALYDINKFRKRLNDGYELYKSFEIQEKETIINAILDGLHANATMSDLKKLKISTPFGKLQLSTGIKLSPNAELIYQSPTGLIERHVKVSDL
ncbi:MAG TPA: type II CRISPR RNA-guided endonuclease Cas9 [Candidatus Ligilactobacillus excrementigallinarum]|uniref:CRISPR-associated endonuclease Cas9 n=1 Tax=Candidatus Ligilactobacillus excrementigallinarum TaxID=2838641 RepID=A0A9D2A8V9_9LACO|nr:type II CRISPR RNA-guided endonuclease Cas9 [Candidatus Ligilactobacillus excrementigallinarum]